MFNILIHLILDSAINQINYISVDSFFGIYEENVSYYNYNIYIIYLHILFLKVQIVNVLLSFNAISK